MRAMLDVAGLHRNGEPESRRLGGSLLGAYLVAVTQSSPKRE